MNIYIGVTDKDWYEQLRHENADEVNFWSPGAAPFKALNENELFLFKLHYPYNCIVGGGFFVRYDRLPPFLAWSAFGRKNGTKSFSELKNRIERYSGKDKITASTQIGCTILTEPFWFDECDWLPVPEWNKNIVRGKIYRTETDVGRKLYYDIQERLASSYPSKQFISQENSKERYSERITKHRLGQGAFRIAVTDAYNYRCAITGEKTLPVLEAAHIVPYADNGQHIVTNGILLKSDFHTLFDDGYITLTKDYKLEVSHRLHDEFGNGEEYYKYHGKAIKVLPDNKQQWPNLSFLEWHNEHIYLG